MPTGDLPINNNRKQGQFEGKVEADLDWIKEVVGKIQELCVERGERIQKCETGLCQFHDTERRLIEQVMKGEERLRDCEKGLTQTKAVGGLLGLLAGFGSQIFGNWWKT